MDPPEPPECSQCGKEITDEPDLYCEICYAILCSDPDCDSKHTEESHPFRGLREAITSADPPGGSLTREGIDESLERLKENEGTTGTMAEQNDDPIKVSVSAEQTVNLGNCESAKVFFSLSNIPHGATEEQIEAALETSEPAFNYVRQVISEKVAAIRRNVQ